MINFEQHTLANGLRVIHSRNTSSQLAAVNLLYGVGSKNENPGKTGLAHFLEHLMFTGTHNYPNFDHTLQAAGGESNAWTNCDFTNFYEVLPKVNLETALCLEADRMTGLALTDESFELQKSVVIEEFKQRCINKPYGEASHLYLPLIYKIHPYRWPTIGMRVEELEKTEKIDVLEFYNQYYSPKNAVLTIVCDLDSDDVFSMVEKWFSHIKGNAVHLLNIVEPKQTEFRSLTFRKSVPARRIYRGYRMGGRLASDYPESDLLTDVLSTGRSSRFYQNIISKGGVMSSIDASISGTIDDWLLMINASLLPGVTFEQADRVIDKEIESMLSNVTDYEIEKCVNKFESNHLFSNINIDECACNLSQYGWLGDANIVNTCIEQYRAITKKTFLEAANKVLDKKNCSELYFDIQ